MCNAVMKHFTDGYSDTPKYTLISDLTYEYDKFGNWTLCYLRCVDGLADFPSRFLPHH